MTIQGLREKRAAKALECSDLVNKANWNAATDQPVYDALLSEIDSIDASISRIQALNERVAKDALEGQIIDAAQRVARDHNSPASAQFVRWVRGGDSALNAQEWQAIRNTMSTTTGSEGGYTVQTEVARTIADALKAFGGMRAPGMATVMQTAQGGLIQFPTSNGTSEEGEIVGENTTATDADISFGVVNLLAHKYSSKVVAVPIELLQDSAVDIEAFVISRLATRLGRITNKHFTIGDGTSKPQGIMVAASVGVTAANGSSQVTAVTYDSLVDLQHSVDPAYREGGNTRWMMNDQSVKVLRKIKDGQSRPIFVPGYEVGVPGGAPDTLLGRPIVINQNVAVMAANAVSIAFGDFSKYMIRDVLDVTVQRYTDSAYAKKGQVGFLAWLRSGGAFTDVGGAVKTFQNAAS